MEKGTPVRLLELADGKLYATPVGPECRQTNREATGRAREKALLQCRGNFGAKRIPKFFTWIRSSPRKLPMEELVILETIVLLEALKSE